MVQKCVSIAAVTVFIVILGIGLVQCGTPLADEQFTLDDADISTSYMDFRFVLSAGDRVAINVSVTGDPVSLFGVYNSTETYDAILLEKRDTASVTEEWVAPYNDTFDFYFKVYSGVADVHFMLTKLTAADQAGTRGGLDPLTIGIIAAVVIVVVFVIALFALRLRKKPGLPIPPPPPAAGTK
jgi:hypothetical protein